LTASAAILGSARQVIVTTGTQVGGMDYTVTVASSVTDNQPLGISAAANTASFVGFVQPAELVINEVNPNISVSRDLVELRVVTGGSLLGIKLEQDINAAVTLATLPAVLVTSGDVVVVHLNPNVSETTEMTSKTDCTSASCYSAAWDIAGGTTGITFSNRLLVVRDVTGRIQDAAAFIVPTSSLATFPANLQALQAAAQWLPADCGGAACTYTTIPTAPAVSVDWSACGTTAAGISVRRASLTDTNQSSDWSAGTSSWGGPNP
jgi:hypothetical protein